MRDQTIEKSGCEGEYSNCGSNAVTTERLVTIEHAIPVSDFISDILKDFSLSLKR